MSRLSVIIPCLNEEKAIDPVLDRFLHFQHLLLEKKIVTYIELIVVDDGSYDRSAEKARTHRSKPIVIKNLSNLGYGGAIKEGLKRASGDLLAFYDMDFTYDSLDLIEMIKCMNRESVDVVCGDRLSHVSKMPFIRMVGNQLFVFTMKTLFGKSSKDCCTGLRLFKAGLKEEFIQNLPNDLNYTLAMTIYMYQRKIAFKEIPVSYCQRIGCSKLSVLTDGPRFLFTIFWYHLKKSN